MKRLAHSAWLTLILASTVAAAVLLSPAAANSQHPLWTVYDTSNSGLPFNSVNALAIDPQGTVWIGTGHWGSYAGGGLAKLDGEDWTVYNTSNSELPHNDHNGLAIDAQGNIWCATEGGLAVFDGENWAAYTTGNSGLPHPQVHGRPVFDAEGNAWLPTLGGGLAKFDGENWRVYNAANSGLPGNTLVPLAFDGEGNLWIGTDGGVAKFDGENWTVYTTEGSGLPGFAWALAFDAQGVLWIGTLEGGLARFDGKDWTVYNTSNSGLPYDSVFALAIDAQGTVWIGTGHPYSPGRGLARFDGEHWTVYDTSNSGLPHNTVSSLAFDDQGNLWIGTGGGLAVYSGTYTRPEIVSATRTPGTTQVGETTSLEVTVVLDPPLESIEMYRGMILDLSPLGTPSDLPLEDAGDGRYTASTTIAPLPNGNYYLPISLETMEGEQDPLLSILLEVYPVEDLIIYEDGPGEGWTVEVIAGASDTASTAFVCSGSCAHAVGPGGCVIQYVCQAAEGIAVYGYTHLEFWINGGEGSDQDLTITGQRLSSLGIAPEANTWIWVSIPVSELADPLNTIAIMGRTEDTFYIDDMKLVAAELPESTAVAEGEVAALPSGYALSQSIPNPFNPTTAITYHLPEASHVDLDVYNITGQHVTTLVSKHQKPGWHRASWDASGYANGVYVYRLQAGTFAEAKRMLLLK